MILSCRQKLSQLHTMWQGLKYPSSKMKRKSTIVLSWEGRINENILIATIRWQEKVKYKILILNK